MFFARWEFESPLVNDIRPFFKWYLVFGGMEDPSIVKERTGLQMTWLNSPSCKASESGDCAAIFACLQEFAKFPNVVKEDRSSQNLVRTVMLYGRKNSENKCILTREEDPDYACPSFISPFFGLENDTFAGSYVDCGGIIPTKTLPASNKGFENVSQISKPKLVRKTRKGL